MYILYKQGIIWENIQISLELEKIFTLLGFQVCLSFYFYAFTLIIMEIS